MSPEVVVAIIAAAIALIALYFNWRMKQIAAETASFAKQQIDIARQVQKDAVQPYVWADIRPDEAVGTLLNLVVGNSGPTIATNVRISIDPPLHAIEQLRDRATAAQTTLAAGLQSLPPGRTYTWPLGQAFNLLNSGQAQSYTINIEFDGPFGRVPAMGYTVDIGTLVGALDKPSGSLHELTKAVKELTKSIPAAYVANEGAPVDSPPAS